MDIFIHSEITALAASNGVFVVRKEEEEHPFHPQRITRLWLPAAVPIEPAALQLALRASVDLILLDDDHLPIGTLQAYAQRKGASLLKQQIRLAAEPEADRQVSLYLLLGQQGRMEVLRSYAELTTESLAPLQAMLDEHAALFVDDRLPPCAALREAPFARSYFRLLATLLPSWCAFERRTRRPATDVFSAALNYGMGWMYAVQFQAVRRAYLNPYWGFHHRPKDGEPALVFDLIEAQRPWVEAGVLELFRSEELQAHHFRTSKEKEAVKISAPIRKRIIRHLHESFQQPQEEEKSRMDRLYELARGFARRLQTQES